MTKNEFDAAFFAGECCVRADTAEEWFAINAYGHTQFGLGKSSAYRDHDCERYPFVFCNETIVDALPEKGDLPVISFAEFANIIREENEENIVCGSLEGVL